MPGSFKTGDKVYIVESVGAIREAEVLKNVSGMVSLRFPDTGGGIRVRESRLYTSKEAAAESVKSRRSGKF